MPLRRTRRNLPHWHRPENSAIYWITFRLADSLPAPKIQLIKNERDLFLTKHPKPWDESVSQLYREQFNDRIQEWLDAGHGSCLLATPALRLHLVSAINRFDGARHNLVSCVIMPNHVHMILRPKNSPLHLLLKAIKGVSARRINQSIGNTGTRIWMEESYDRIIRSKEELEAFRKYIRNNPINLPQNSYWLLDRDPTFKLKSDPAHETLHAFDEKT